MRNPSEEPSSEMEAVESKEWLESLDYALEHSGRERLTRLLRELDVHARLAGLEPPFTANTPYINTIPAK